MKPFMDEHFLLTTDTAKELFAACKDEPIFDWHCHLSPKEIYENKQPRDLAELWLGGDHYKWRAMRSCGISEDYITSEKNTPYHKFRAWAQAMPQLIGNPLYHWTHLELQRYFGITKPLSPATCDEIWEQANAAINAGGFTPRELIEKSNVKIVCTTDDAADTLEWHEKIAADRSFACRVLPAFRPDKALAVESEGFAYWLTQLENVSGRSVNSFSDLCGALADRIGFFAAHGCRAADHGLLYVPFRRANQAELDAVIQKKQSGKHLTTEEADAFKTELLLFLADEYSARGWGMELHIGPMRNNNTTMFCNLGPDTGFDSIGDRQIAEPLSRLLDAMNTEWRLPRTVLFCLNPKDNYVIGSMLGNFQSDEVPGKMQMGSAWWFNDNYDGMRAQLQTVMNLGALGTFIGMITDSRSFLSYPRHEYFRRILCELLGDLVEEGKYPADMAFLTETVRNISYHNAVRYFGVG